MRLAKRNHRGVSLIEVVIASAILAAVFAGLAVLLQRTIAVTASARVRSDATQIGYSYLERARALSCGLETGEETATLDPARCAPDVLQVPAAFGDWDSTYSAYGKTWTITSRSYWVPNSVTSGTQPVTLVRSVMVRWPENGVLAAECTDNKTPGCRIFYDSATRPPNDPKYATTNLGQVKVCVAPGTSVSLFDSSNATSRPEITRIAGTNGAVLFPFVSADALPERAYQIGSGNKTNITVVAGSVTTIGSGC